MSKMRVADFFCGAGGFSEGFRQMGFEVAFALDNWKPAIDTHIFNHGEACMHSDKDILSISVDDIDKVIPDTEVIIGSPPCVAFSGSNRAGKADKSLGLKLIEKYLQIVAYKKNKPGSLLRYWVLENVPNTKGFIKGSYTFEELGLPGGSKVALDVPIIEVYNAADFGAPQTRSRLFCGEYPKPTPTHKENEWVTLGAVLNSLDVKSISNKVSDVNYGFSIAKEHLTDHFYLPMISDFEWKNAKKLKRDHSFMGKMAFPEDVSRPSRTIMATMSSSTREAMVIGERGHDGNDIFRRPTIREVASLMSFPITYQFISGSEGGKYRLVGNAVCCKMAAAVARAILEKEGAKIRYRPNPHPDFKSPPFDLNGTGTETRHPSPRKLTARFRMHVPELKIRSYRVDIDNLASDFESEKFEWRAVLHHGTGKKAEMATITNEKIERMMLLVPNFNDFREDLIRSFVGKLPGPTEFQLSYCRLGHGGTIGPEDALGMVKLLVDKHFPEDRYLKKEIRCCDSIHVEGVGIPLRILVSLYACNIVTGIVMSIF